MIYFIKSGKYVKIGKTNNLDQRVKQLQTASPYPLKVLAVMDWANSAESILHELYKTQKATGEWFLYDGKLKWAIIAYNSYKKSSSPKEFWQVGTELWLKNKSKRSPRVKERIGRLNQ